MRTQRYPRASYVQFVTQSLDKQTQKSKKIKNKIKVEHIYPKKKKIAP